VAGHEGWWPIGGQIDILSNTQNSVLNGGAHYGSPAVYSNQGHRKESENLQDFHSYGVEWNETHIQWFFDDQDQLQNLDINRTLSDAYERKGQPFDRPFKLQLELGVGGDADYLFPGQTLTDNDYKSWKCSALIIDYIRVYQWVDSPNSCYITGGDRTSSADICEDVMSHIRSYNKTDDNKSISTNPTGLTKPTNTVPLTSIILIIFGLIIIILLLIIIFQYIRYYRLKGSNEEFNENSYENCIVSYDHLKSNQA